MSTLKSTLEDQMRNKLQKFTDFAHSLLPHETQYLLSVQHLEDPTRLEILQYRWHTFFSAYLETLVRQQHFQKILHIADKYRLLEKERRYESRADYVPTILWFTLTAQYKEGRIDKNAIRQKLEQSLSVQRPEQRPQIAELLSELRPIIPEVVHFLPYIPNTP